MSHSSIYLGTREPFSYSDGDRHVPFTLDPAQHTYIIGASGSGKTYLIRNILMQMIARGDGVGILDPHGDISEELLDFIPSNRTRDVCYFNPADLRYPIAWNPLASVPEDKRHLVTEDTLASFKNLFGNSWGYQTEHILRNSIGALIEAKNTSLLGIRRLLIDPDYRRTILKQVTNPLVLSFWHHEFDKWEQDPKFFRPAIAPVQNKIGALFDNPIARNILGQVQNRLDIRALMDTRAIIIARLPKGIIGQSAATTLGALLMTKFQQAALERADIEEKTRVPFSLFVDEFQSFLTDEPEAFASTLAEARKYKLYLTLSHQFLAQIHNEELKHAVVSQAGNLLTFRVSGQDAAFLEDTFSEDVQRKVFVRLGRGEVITRLIENGDPTIPFKGTLASTPPKRYAQREKIITGSRRQFTHPRHVVEDRITEFLPVPEPSKTPAVVRRARR